ncbi:MAG: aldo/keto reductase [Victivallales bacterium]|nr:aldo/keto reductase [Victivallales bacterium]
MDRREFLKHAATLALFAPLARFGAFAAEDVPAIPGLTDKKSEIAEGPQVARRPYKNTALTVPLLGMGMMRLPTKGRGIIDYEAARKLVERAMRAGINYFDTAWFYHKGESENCVGELLSKYPRESYYLADKMPCRVLETEADVDRIFKEQLRKCKVEYFDFYLMHALNARTWKKSQELHVYEYLKKQQAAGKIRLLGFSFHDNYQVLREIANAKEWDFCQIQLNYIDWKAYHSKEQYEILTRRGIPAVLMEPLKGGRLAKIRPEAEAILRKARPNDTPAAWAFRFAGSLPNVLVMLSGMTRMEHMEENIKTFSPFEPLTEQERLVLAEAFGKDAVDAVPCTTCEYCLPCPATVNIPRVFKIYNGYKSSGDKEQFKKDLGALDAEDHGAKACVSCGLCLKKCPQKIPIPTWMGTIVREQTLAQK